MKFSEASRRGGASPQMAESVSASHDASSRLGPTPTVLQERWPSVISISTRVIASVPCIESRMRTLKSMSSNVSSSG